MINNISWPDYWSAIAIAVTFYYAVVAALYYRFELGILFAGKFYRQFLEGANLKSAGNANADADAVPDSSCDHGTGEEERLAGTSILPAGIQSLVDELNAFFQQAIERTWTKAELIQSLRGILSKYPFVQRSDYRSPLNTFIQLQAELDCSIHLDEEDSDLLWRE